MVIVPRDWAAPPRAVITQQDVMNRAYRDFLSSGSSVPPQIEFNGRHLTVERQRGPLLMDIARFSRPRGNLQVNLCHMEDQVVRIDVLAQHSIARALHPDLTIIPVAARYTSIVFNGLRATDAVSFYPTWGTRPEQDHFILEIDNVSKCIFRVKQSSFLSVGLTG